MGDESTGEIQEGKKKSPSCGFLMILAVIFFLVASIVMDPSHMAYHSSGIHRTNRCAYQLNQFRSVLYQYAEEHDGYFPPLSSTQGELMVDVAELPREQITNGHIYVCDIHRENDSSAVDGHANEHTFYYLNHVVTSEVEGLALVDAYRVAVLEGEDFTDELRTQDGSVIPRIRMDESGEYSTRRIPVLIEMMGHHPKDPYIVRSMTEGQEFDGAHVLFLNGQIECLKMDSGFPMTTAFIEALESIDE